MQRVVVKVVTEIPFFVAVAFFVILSTCAFAPAIHPLVAMPPENG